MKRLFLIVAITLLASFYMNPLSTDAALVDGIHTINYQVNKPDSSSASIANDYFTKPAKLIVDNGTMKVQITIKNSSWVTEFNPPGGVTVISSNPGSNERVVQFSINNFNPIRVEMTVDIDDLDYHHSYGTDFVFFENSIQLVEAAQKPQQNTQPNTGSQSSNNQNVETEENGESANNSQNNNSQGSSSSNNSQGVTSNNSSSSNSNSSSTNSNTSEQPSEGEEADDPTDVEQNEEGQEQNPDTSDSFPFVYVVMLLVAALVLVKNKNILKN